MLLALLLVSKASLSRRNFFVQVFIDRNSCGYMVGNRLKLRRSLRNLRL